MEIYALCLTKTKCFFNIKCDLTIKDSNILGNVNVSFSTSYDEKAKIISKIAPYSKVLFLTLKQDNCQVLNFINACKNSGVKIITVFLEDSFTFSVDNVCELFNMPEDVRAVMTDKSNLIDAVKYISKIKYVSSIFILDHIVNGMFCNKVFIKNAQEIDLFYADNSKYFILNNQIDILSLYRTAMFYPICLIDLLARTEMTSATLDKNFFDFKRSIIRIVQSLLLNDINNALKHILHIESTLSKKQDLLYQSSPFITKTILDRYDNDTFISLLNYTAKRYQVAFTNKNLNSEDYSSRAKELSFIANVNPLVALRWIKGQLELVDHKCFEFGSIKNEVKSIYSLFSKMLNEYIRLGGTIKALTYTEKRAVELSGDTGFGLNFFSAYREYCARIKI